MKTFWIIDINLQIEYIGNFDDFDSAEQFLLENQKEAILLLTNETIDKWQEFFDKRSLS